MIYSAQKLAAGFLVAAGMVTRLAGAEGAGEAEFFERRIRPVLAEQCYECHSATSPKLKGGLRVDSRAALLQGGETGPAVVPGKPEASLLVKALAHTDPDLAMPPKKPALAAAVRHDFEAWVREGAFWPAETNAAPVAAAADGGFDLEERKRRLPWLWETPRHAALPAVRDIQWPQSREDHFILARLEKDGLRPAPAAAPEQWLRRVYYALVGLPPAPDELAAFLADRSPTAREWVVDRLLASPQFGERWGRHWLDLVRYAESRGHESDFIIPNAYEYRDYVIRALNADVPYDAFVREHLAGDLLPAPRRNPEKGFNESILGTGWAFLGEEIHAPVDTRQDENDRIDNRIDVLSKTFLGLTVSCARCHDHKFDAITQRDYYALAGFFISSSERLARFETLETERAAAAQLEALRERWRAQWPAKIAAAEAPVLGRLKDYLVAAATAAGTNAAPKAGTRLAAAALPGPVTEAVARLAAEHSLATNVLAHWTAALLTAVNDEHDLLHPLAQAARGTSGNAGGEAPATTLPAGARVIVDYGHLGAAQWYQDGVAFGPRPRPADEWLPLAPTGGAAAGLRLVTRTAALADGDWRELDLGAGVEREPAMYGGWKRDGVMLRSPKFELTTGQIYYLVRGSGRVLAAVDSQRLVTGPVQTAQVHEWGFADRWHWVAQDLTEYAGHRVEMEFSPSGEFRTEIARIIESPTPPTDPPSVGHALARSLREWNLGTVPTLAGVYQEILTAATQPGATGNAGEIQAWLAERPELFSGRPGEWPEPVAGALRDYLRERQPLMSRVQWTSRTAPAMLEGNGVDEYLLVRGKPQSPKGQVPRRFLECLAGPAPLANAEGGSGRRELAQLITASTNPLFARVLVNRAWHHLFGRGLVPTVDNFGWLGQRPSHPELLDDLAASFVAEDHYSLKRLLRRLVLSRTYAMASKPADAEAEAKDPENLLLHRQNLQRIEGEAIRDAMLTVSGRLDRRMFGVSVPLHPSQFVEARGLRSERGPLDGDGRRSIYVAARRNFLPMMMTAFDTPTPFTTIGRRNVSNVPGQMLFLMNDPFVHQQAGVWAERLLRELPHATPAERVNWLYRAAFTREPTPEEAARCLAAVREAAGGGDPAQAPRETWTELCHALFGVKEFMYVR